MHDDASSRRVRTDVTIMVVVTLLVFLGSFLLPADQWLGLALQHQAHHLDDIVVACVAMSFVLLGFFVYRSRSSRDEAKARARLVQQLEKNAHLDTQLSQMTNLLQSCLAADEANQIIFHYARQLFPDDTVALYVFRSSRNLLEVATIWGEEQGHEPMFAPHQCWALRQGQIYEVQDSNVSIPCAHVKVPIPYICLPMVARGEVLALLHAHPNSMEANTMISEAHRRLLRIFAEHIALAISNLKLRDALRQQSIRDPLTGLFNRRYLEETLSIEIERAKRSDVPFSVVMLDVDHFKRFNDTHSHDAGDAVLQALGRLLQRHTRGGDIACRYGGEEFTLILPGAAKEVAQKRAEQLCEDIRALNVEFKGQSLGPMTLSVGIAAFPGHGQTGEIVLQAADMALYQAKSDGRDRVVVAV